MDVLIPRRRRRTHSESFKQAVVSACSEPGASVAGVALANGINANQVRRWMRERGAEPPSRRSARPVAVSEPSLPGFVPVQVTPSAEAVIRLEVRRGAAVVKIEWPAETASVCGAWLRDWLA